MAVINTDGFEIEAKIKNGDRQRYSLSILKCNTDVVIA